MLAFIAWVICSKTSSALRRRRTSAATILYLNTAGTLGFMRYRPRRRGNPVCSLRLRVSERTGW